MINQEVHTIIADDLAGACDCAVEFLGPGRQVRIWTGTGPLREISRSNDTGVKTESGMLAVNTESRHREPGEAVAITRMAATYARESGARIVIKKADSAFRGNYVTELVTTVSALSPAAVVVAPAIPDYGRTTIDGVQHIDGVPIAESFYAADPRSAVQVSRIADILLDTGFVLAEVSLKALRARSVAIDPTGALRVYIVDGETNADLDLTAEIFAPGGTGFAGGRRDGPVLFVGGQGITAALARRTLPGRTIGDAESRESDASDREGYHGPAMRGAAIIVCGSLHPQARRQLDHILRRTKMSPVVTGASSDADAVGALRRAAEADGAAILTTSPRRRQPAAELEERIAVVCRDLSRLTAIRALFLTGGGTAFSVCRTLGIEAIDLREKLADGTVVASPTESELPEVCIKGGSLGPDDVMELFLRRFAP